jgi:hypothetical protein
MINILPNQELFATIEIFGGIQANRPRPTLDFDELSRVVGKPDWGRKTYFQSQGG